MTNVIGIEFCADYYKNEDDCYAWIQQSDFHGLLRVKGFSLRRNKQAKLLTNERHRSVWRWSLPLGTYKEINVHRPNSLVVIFEAAGSRFAPTELPALLPSTVKHEQEKKEKHEARMAEQRAIRALKNKDKPPKEKKSKKARAGVKEGTKGRKKPISGAAYLAEQGITYGIPMGKLEYEGAAQQ